MKAERTVVLWATGAVWSLRSLLGHPAARGTYDERGRPTRAEWAADRALHNRIGENWRGVRWQSRCDLVLHGRQSGCRSEDEWAKQKMKKRTNRAPRSGDHRTFGVDRPELRDDRPTG